MELNRNQYFLGGLLVLLLGIQLRMVDAFVLNEQATHFLHQRMQQIKAQQFASAGEASATLAAATPTAKHRLQPPDWLGWSLVSVGSVLILYSLALKKPGG